MSIGPRVLIREHLARDEIIPEELRGDHLYERIHGGPEALSDQLRCQSRTALPRNRTREAVRGERLLGWERLIIGPIEVHGINSNHVGLMSRRNVERMGAILRKRLDEAGRPKGENVYMPRDAAPADERLHPVGAE